MKHDPSLALVAPFFEEMIECLGDCFYAIDPDWKIVYWNKKTELLTGKKKAAVLGKNIKEVYPLAETVFAAFEKAIATRAPVHFETFSPTLSIYFAVNAYPTAGGLGVYMHDITEKKQLEKQRDRVNASLQHTSDILTSTLENMPDGFCATDKDWRFTYINEKLATMLCGDKERFIGKNIWECFPYGVNTAFYTVYHQAFEEQRSMRIEEFYAPLNVWFEVNIHPNKEGLSFFIKDVSERKKQEQRMEFISKASTEMTWEYDFARDEYLFDSKKFEELFGYATEPGPHAPSFWLDKIPAPDFEVIMSNRTYAIEHKYDFYLSEFRLKKANGLVAHVRARVYLVRNPEGKVVSLIGSMEDITMEKLSEKSLMESIESYRYLFDNAPLPTIIFDAKTFEILDANTAMSTQYGYSKGELLSMTVLAVHPVEVQQNVRDITAGLKPFTRTDVPLIEHIKKNGERILVEVSATHIHYKNKPAILATANDITEKIRLQEQITQAKVDRQKSITKATLEAQERERSELAKEVHDNVNQILAAAKLYFENAADPGQNNLFITKGTVLLQGAIDEIRKLSRTLTSPTLRGLSFTESLDDLLSAYNDLGLLRIQHQFDFEEELLGKGLCLSVYRILQEQVNNTVKYANAKTICIEVHTKYNQLYVKYQDDGIGFNPVIVKKGLGLNNIQHRVDAYNGKMEIKTAPSKGYEMEAWFPL